MPEDWRDQVVEQRVASAATRWQSRSWLSRLGEALLIATMIDSGAVGLTLLSRRQDPDAGTAGLVVIFILTLVAVVWFVVAPGRFLRWTIRSTLPKEEDPGKHPPMIP